MYSSLNTIHVSYTVQLSYIQVDTYIHIYKFAEISYSFPPAVLTLGLCNHTTQETGLYDHEEYGTVQRRYIMTHEEVTNL
jgi:hypothetical protein